MLGDTYTRLRDDRQQGIVTRSISPAFGKERTLDYSRAVNTIENGVEADVPGLLFREHRGIDGIPVVTVYSGGAAEREGHIRPGDIIISVDGRNVEGKPLQVVRQLLNGAPATLVSLSFRRPGMGNLINIGMMRDDFGANKPAAAVSPPAPLPQPTSSLRNSLSELPPLVRQSPEANEINRLRSELENTQSQIRGMEEALQHERRVRELLENDAMEAKMRDPDGYAPDVRNQLRNVTEQLHHDRSVLSAQRDKLLQQLSIERAEKEALTDHLRQERSLREVMALQLQQAANDVGGNHQQFQFAIQEERRQNEAVREQLAAEKERRATVESQLAQEREMRRKLAEDLESEVRERVNSMEEGDAVARLEMERLREQVNILEDASRRDKIALEDADVRNRTLSERLILSEERVAELQRQIRSLGELEFNRARLLEENEILRRDLTHRELQLSKVMAENREMQDRLRRVVDDRQIFRDDLNYSIKSQEQAAADRRKLELEIVKIQDQLRSLQTPPPPPPPPTQQRPATPPPPPAAVPPTPSAAPSMPMNGSVEDRMKYIMQLREQNEARERQLGIVPRSVSATPYMSAAAPQMPPQTQPPPPPPPSAQPVDNPPPQQTLPVNPSIKGGIGIVFDDDGNNQGLPVRTLLAGGSAAESGISIGDKLISVDDMLCVGMKNAEVKEYVKGPLNSTVRLEFRRFQPLAFGQEHYTVTLVRNRPLETVSSTNRGLDGSISSQSGLL